MRPLHREKPRWRVCQNKRAYVQLQSFADAAVAYKLTTAASAKARYSEHPRAGMRTYYVDETGFTGEDLLSEDQPIFTQATNDFSNDEVNYFIQFTFSGVGSAELKYNRLARNGRHHDKIIKLVRILAVDPLRVGAWVAHKEYALMTLIVDWWMEPLAHMGGLNLYKDGANHGMANMLFYCLEGFWSAAFRRKLLLYFQRMFRSGRWSDTNNAEHSWKKKRCGWTTARTKSCATSRCRS